MNDLIKEIQDLRYLNWARSRKFSGTAGSFLKAYDDTGRKKIYYKLSDYDCLKGIVGHECVNEIIAGRLMDLLGINHLKYTLIPADIVIDGKEYRSFLCSSYDFKEPGEAKLPLEDFFQMERLDGETPLTFCRRMGWADHIYDMLVIDFLISNRDRHGANIEILFNRKKQELRPAPLFDHGLSFVCRCHDPGELKDFDVMKDIRIQSFIGGGSAFENLKLVPASHLRRLGNIEKKDLGMLFDGLEGILDERYYEKIREMISRRWKYIEDLRNP